MACLINPVKEDQCVILRCEGAMPTIEIVAARYEASGLLKRKRWKKLVVNITGLKSMPTTLELIDLASDLSSDLPWSTRVALVVRPDQIRESKLVERVARNEGVLLTSFFNAERATTWVKGINPQKRTERLQIETKTKKNEHIIVCDTGGVHACLCHALAQPVRAPANRESPQAEAGTPLADAEGRAPHAKSASKAVTGAASGQNEQRAKGILRVPCRLPRDLDDWLHVEPVTIAAKDPSGMKSRQT